MGNGKKKRGDGLHSDVLEFKCSEDEDGKYIPYCDCDYHLGAVLHENVCQTRQCERYMKL